MQFGNDGGGGGLCRGSKPKKVPHVDHWETHMTHEEEVTITR